MWEGGCEPQKNWIHPACHANTRLLYQSTHWAFPQKLSAVEDWQCQHLITQPSSGSANILLNWKGRWIELPSLFSEGYQSTCICLEDKRFEPGFYLFIYLFLCFISTPPPFIFKWGLRNCWSYHRDSDAYQPNSGSCSWTEFTHTHTHTLHPFFTHLP